MTSSIAAFGSLLLLLILIVGVMPSGVSTPAFSSAFSSHRGEHSLAASPEEGGMAAAAGTGLSSPTWTQLIPGSHPSARWGAGTVYDAADGYVLLFGGDQDSPEYPWTGPLTTNCSNETWTFHGGEWVRLNGTSPPAACFPAMAYDPIRHYVLTYLAWTNETWSFVHGKWTRLFVPEPDSAIGECGGCYQRWNDWGTLSTYDPEYGTILLFEDHYNNVTKSSDVEETWEYTSGGWNRILSTAVPWITFPLSGRLAYDYADGYALLQAMNTSATDSQTAPAAWSFRNGTFTDEGLLPLSLVSCYCGQEYNPPTITYDERDGYVLVFSSPALGGTTQINYASFTWTYRDGAWTNESIAGPPGRQEPSLVFDPADGYVVLFGGIRPTDSPALMSDTWIYSGPPVADRLSIRSSPSHICSVASENCGAGVDEARVNLSVDVVPASTSISGWIDSGNGTVEYGPDYSFLSPTMTFVGRWNIVPAPNLDPQVVCTRGGGGPAICNATPQIGQNGGLTSLTWSWGGSASSLDALWQGDEWHVSFNVVATGPPFGTLPIDTCDTTLCFERGAGVDLGTFSSFSFGVGNGSSGALDSFPLDTVTVLPPQIQSPPTPTSAPPSIPPPTSPPLPISTPSPLTPVPLPIIVPIASVAVVSSISLTAIAAGIVAAGAARAVIAERAQRLAVVTRVSARPKNRGPP